MDIQFVIRRISILIWNILIYSPPQYDTMPPKYNQLSKIKVNQQENLVKDIECKVVNKHYTTSQ